jgi:lysophospholipase L1-like esterase
MTHVFFIGRNNAGQVDIIMSHFRSMIAHIGSYAKRFIVIPYLPGRSEPIGSDAYESRKALLTACLTEWPRNTLDLLPDLIAAHDPTDAQDVADVADGVPPSSLMTDNVHPNAAGRVVVAQSVHEFITSNGVLK